MALQILIMKFNIISSFKIIKLATAGAPMAHEGKEGHTDAEQRKSTGVSSILAVKLFML
jgi:hypothetical protein